MQLLLDFINIPVPAVSVISRVNLTLTFDFISNSIDDLFLFIRSIELSNLSRGKQIVDVNQELFICNLTLGKQE
jgi:hypothetical protein